MLLILKVNSFATVKPWLLSVNIINFLLIKCFGLVSSRLSFCLIIVSPLCHAQLLKYFFCRKMYVEIKTMTHYVSHLAP